MLVEGEVVGDVAEFLFDGAYGFKVSGAVERVAAAGKQADEVTRYISTRHIESAREVIEHSALIHGNDVSDTITTVNHYTRRQALCVEGEHGLNGDIYAAKVVALKHDFGHHFAVLEGVHWRFGEQDLATGGVDFHLLEEGVVPEVLHVVPALDDTVFHLSRCFRISSYCKADIGDCFFLGKAYGIGDLQHGSGGGGLVTAHDVLELDI